MSQRESDKKKGQSYYQKQVSWLPTLLRDLHEGAFFDKYLAKKQAKKQNIQAFKKICLLVKWILNANNITIIQDHVFHAFSGSKRNGFQMMLENSVLLHDSHPSRLQEVPLPLHAVLYVDQTQQVLLQEKRGRETDEDYSGWMTGTTQRSAIFECLSMKVQGGGKGCDAEV